LGDLKALLRKVAKVSQIGNPNNKQVKIGKALQSCYNNEFASLEDRCPRKRCFNLSTGQQGVLLAKMFQQVRAIPEKIPQELQ